MAGDTDDIDELLRQLVHDDEPAEPLPAGDAGAEPGAGPGTLGGHPGAATGFGAGAAGVGKTTGKVPRVRTKWRRGLLAVLALSVVVNVVALTFLALWWAGRDDDSTTVDEVAATGLTTDTIEPSPGNGTATGESDNESTTSETGVTTTEDGTITSVAPTDENPAGAVQYAVITSDNKVRLRGLVPSAELAAEYVELGEMVLGPGNAIDEYTIDPAAPVSIERFPVYFEDAVLFAFNSVEIDPAFRPLLDRVPQLFAMDEDVTITVIARTDAVGDEDVNLEISEQRADTVIDYWVDKGVDRDRLIADPRGEEHASGSEGDQAAALDRRVEFVIDGLLG